MLEGRRVDAVYEPIYAARYPVFADGTLGEVVPLFPVLERRSEVLAVVKLGDISVLDRGRYLYVLEYVVKGAVIVADGFEIFHFPVTPSFPNGAKSVLFKFSPPGLVEPSAVNVGAYTLKASFYAGGVSYSRGAEFRAAALRDLNKKNRLGEGVPVTVLKTGLKPNEMLWAKISWPKGFVQKAADTTDTTGAKAS